MLLTLFACSEKATQAKHKDLVQPPVSDLARVVTSDVEPWGFMDDEGNAQGMLMDFQRALFARAQVPFDNHMQPYPRVIHAIASGNADLAVMFKSPMADEVAVSLGHVLSVPIVIVVMATDNRHYQTLDDFKGMVVGHVRGSKYGPAFDDNKNFEHLSIAHVDQALRMLKAGRIDAMTSTKQSLLFAMHQTGFAGEQLRVALPLFEANADLYVAKRAAHAPWVPKLKAALEAMRADGSLTPSFYQSNYWPYFELCFYGNECIGTQ